MPKRLRYNAVALIADRAADCMTKLQLSLLRKNKINDVLQVVGLDAKPECA